MRAAQHIPGARRRCILSKILKDRVKARIEALGIGPIPLAKSVDLERTFIHALLIGRKENVRIDKMAQVARALQCDPRYLTGEIDTIWPIESHSPAAIVEDRQMNGAFEEPPAPPLLAPPAPTYRPPPEMFDAKEKMPVYSSAEGGQGVLVIDTDPIDWVERPHTLAHVRRAFAIVVSGDSMVPAYKPNDRAWVNPQRRPIAGQDCVVYQNNETLGEERLLIKEFVRETEADFVVKQHNPPKELKLSKRDWHRIYLVTGRFNRD
jgi:SOS-response transcriptional repressor LexA